MHSTLGGRSSNCPSPSWSLCEYRLLPEIHIGHRRACHTSPVESGIRPKRVVAWSISVAESPDDKWCSELALNESKYPSRRMRRIIVAQNSA